MGCVNGTEIHKYLGPSFTIHKCLNVVWMSLFYYIFLYLYFQEIFNELGEMVEIIFRGKKLISHRPPL